MNIKMIDFWAPWCGPCKAMSPIVDELKEELEGRAEVEKVNVENNMELAEANDVRSLPCFVFFENGKEYDRVIGSTSKDRLKSLIEKRLT